MISFNLKPLHNKLEIYNKHRSVNRKNESLHAIYLLLLFMPHDRSPLPLISNSHSIIWVNSYSLETVYISSQPIYVSSEGVN